MVTGVDLMNSILLLAVAVLTSVNTYYSRKTEKNTNSMKDALVLTTAIASDAVGFERGRQMEKTEQKEEKK